MANIFIETVERAYCNWTENEGYWNESALENGRYDGVKSKIIETVGEKEWRKIEDDVCNIGCDSEWSGFKAGFIRGMMLMTEAMKEANSI